jgi:hypothetical protein
MALIKTVAEIKTLLPKFISNTTAPDALPQFDQAEYKHLVPVVGATLYNTIHGKYNDVGYPGNMSADEVTLLKKMRMLSTVNAFLDEMALGQLTITENGFKKFSKEEIKMWEFNKAEANLKTIAADAKEVLLSYLFETKPAEWTASDAYKQFNAALIKTPAEFTGMETLRQPSLTFFSIRPRMIQAQKLYLVKDIGEDLLKYLIETATPEGLNIDALKTALAFFTIKQSCQHDKVQISSEGFTVLATGANESVDAGKTNAGNVDIEAKINACDKDGNTFLASAKEELVKYYKTDDAVAEYKTAFEKGPLTALVNPVEKTSGNEKRKGVFRL